VLWRWNAGARSPDSSAHVQSCIALYSILDRIRTFGILRGCFRTMGPRAVFGAVNLAEVPGPCRAWCGPRSAASRRDATPGKLRSFQMTQLARARNLLGLQSSRLQSPKEENHHDSMMIQANSSICYCLLHLFDCIACTAFGRDLASCA
jgi:hypothetical protein